MPVAKTKPAKTDVKARARPDEPGSRLFFSPAGPWLENGSQTNNTTHLLCKPKGLPFSFGDMREKETIERYKSKPSKPFKNQIQTIRSIQFLFLPNSDRWRSLQFRQCRRFRQLPKRPVKVWPVASFATVRSIVEPSDEIKADPFERPPKMYENMKDV